MNRILPTILATLLQHPRWKDKKLGWYKKSFVGNLFVLWKKLFWQPCGKNGIGDTIWIESRTNTYIGEDEREYIERHFYTWEIFFVYLESQLIAFFKRLRFECEWSYVTFLQFAPVGFSNRTSGIPIVSLRIRFDRVGTETAAAAASKTISFSVSVSGNGVVLITDQNNSTTDTVTSCTYAGVSATLTKFWDGTGGTGNGFHVFSALNPTGGTNNATMDSSAANIRRMQVTAYFGIDTKKYPDSTPSGHNQSTGANKTVTITSIAANCWGFMFGNANTATTAGSNTVVRSTSTGDWTVSDTGAGQLPAGNFTMRWTFTSTQSSATFFSIAPTDASFFVKPLRPAIFVPGSAR